MKMTIDWVDALFVYGVDRTNRRVFLFDDVDNMPIGLVIKALYLMETESAKQPIELFVGSYGGCQYDMLALYDTIQKCKAPIHTVAIGKCMSAAPLLVACGKKGHRYAAPNTYFMVHQGHGDLGGKMDEVKNDLAHFGDIEKKWNGLMAKHSKMPPEFWKAQCQKVGDKYFDANQAMEWGLIDHIWEK